MRHSIGQGLYFRKLMTEGSLVVSMLLLVIQVILIGCSETPQDQLLTAATLGEAAKVEALLSDVKNVDVNYQTSVTHSTALLAASGQQHSDVVRILLSRGANPNLATNEGHTPLHSAAYHGYGDIVVMLIAAGAEVNVVETRYGYTPLADAAKNGHTEVVRTLLDAGAQRDARIKDGRTPVDLARFFNKTETVKLLSSYQSEGNGAGH